MKKAILTISFAILSLNIVAQCSWVFVIGRENKWLHKPIGIGTEELKRKVFLQLYIRGHQQFLLVNIKKSGYLDPSTLEIKFNKKSMTFKATHLRVEDFEIGGVAVFNDRAKLPEFKYYFIRDLETDDNRFYLFEITAEQIDLLKNQVIGQIELDNGIELIPKKTLGKKLGKMFNCVY